MTTNDQHFHSSSDSQSQIHTTVITHRHIYIKQQETFLMSYTTYPADVSIVCDRWGQCTDCSQKMQRRQWCLHLLQVKQTTATVLFTLQVRFTFDRCKMHSMQLLDLCCTSRSLTISLLTFGMAVSAYGAVKPCPLLELDLRDRFIGYHFSSGWSIRSVYWSTSASIKQPHHIWLRCASTSQQPTTDVTSALQRTATWQFHKSDWQDTVEEVSLYLVRCCGTHYHWLFVMYHWHWLSSAHNWRLFCFPEHTGHHSS